MKNKKRLARDQASKENKILLSAGRHKNPFNFSIDIVFFRTFEIPFKSKITKC